MELKSADNYSAEAELKIDGEVSDPEIRSQAEEEAVVIDLAGGEEDSDEELPEKVA